jgi:hypothetical protein
MRHLFQSYCPFVIKPVSVLASQTPGQQYFTVGMPQLTMRQVDEQRPWWLSNLEESAQNASRPSHCEARLAEEINSIRFDGHKPFLQSGVSIDQGFSTRVAQHRLYDYYFPQP